MCICGSGCASIAMVDVTLALEFSTNTSTPYTIILSYIPLVECFLPFSFSLTLSYHIRTHTQWVYNDFEYMQTIVANNLYLWYRHAYIVASIPLHLESMLILCSWDKCKCFVYDLCHWLTSNYDDDRHRSPAIDWQ